MVEAALFDYLSLLPIDIRVLGDDRRSIGSLAEQLWDVSESERFRRLAIIAAHLMTYEEQKIWSVLTKNAFFWGGHWERLGASQAIFVPVLRAEKLLAYRLEENWELLEAVAAGRKEPSDLPQPLGILFWEDELMESRLAPPLVQVEASARSS